MITNADGLKALAAKNPSPAARPSALAEEPGKLEQVTDVVRDAFVSQAALPDIVYPSVFGATQAERASINAVLDSLPLHDVGAVATVTVQPDMGNPCLLGLNKMTIGSIDLNRAGYGMGSNEEFQYTLVHEVGHSVDMPDRGIQYALGPNSRGGPWGQGQRITEYAKTNNFEDFAESYAHSRLDPKELEQVAPEKLKALQELDKPQGLEALMEQPAFRESGKALGQMLEVTPWIRWGAEFLGQATILITGAKGVTDTITGAATGDGRLALSGLMRTGAATSFALAFNNPVIAPAGLALLGADHGLHKATQAGADAKTTAAAMAAAGVGGVVGGVGLPLGLTWAGYQAAGPVGGAVGLVLGSVVGHHLGASAGAGAVLALAKHAEKADPAEQAPKETPAPRFRATPALA